MSLKSSLLAGAAVAVLAASPVMAQSAPSQAQIDTLSQQIQALQSQLTSLKDSVAKESAANKKALDALPKVSVDGGRLRVQSADKAFDVSVRGRLHFDYGFYNAGKNFTADATDGFQTRRALLGVVGKVYTDWTYELTTDFSSNRGGGVGLYNANLSYTGFKGVTITAGVQQPKFTLEDSTSSNDIPFLERSQITNVVVGIGGNDSRVAFGATKKDSNYIVAAYVTGNRTNTTGNVDDQVNLLGRAAYSFWQGSEGSAGLGVSGVYQTTPQQAARPVAAGTATTSIAFSDRPSLRIGGSPTVLTNTGAISQIDGAYGYGADFGGNYKSFWAAAEYYTVGAKYSDLTAAGARQTFDDPEFTGYYIAAGYILTGERRNYNVGEWAGVKPAWPVGQNGFGAWEIAARYSRIDLVDRKGGVAGSGTGVEEDWTFGVNWYVNGAIRVLANYVVAETVRPNGTKVDLDLAAVRLQFQF